MIQRQMRLMIVTTIVFLFLGAITMIGSIETLKVTNQQVVEMQEARGQ